MMRTLIWKEYREQRGFWLALALLAIGLCLSMATLIPRVADRIVDRASLADSIAEYLPAYSILVALTYALVSSAMLFSGERQAGTAAFLETLPARRSQIWLTKVLVGISLNLAMVLVVFGLLYLLVVFLAPAQIQAKEGLVLILVLALDVFCWGIVVSTLMRKSLSAIFLAIFVFLFSFQITVLVVTPNAFWQLSYFGLVRWAIYPELHIQLPDLTPFLAIRALLACGALVASFIVFEKQRGS
jgi:ABC-type transport system involved in multi-copper enzyme maturation permease subunit